MNSPARLRRGKRRSKPWVRLLCDCDPMRTSHLLTPRLTHAGIGHATLRLHSVEVLVAAIARAAQREARLPRVDQDVAPDRLAVRDSPPEEQREHRLALRRGEIVRGSHGC